MYHIWSYVDSMFDNMVIWWSDGGSHIFLFNSSAGFQRWVMWLQGEMASLTHISPSPLRKKSPNLNARSPKKCRWQNPRRGHTSFINTPADPESQESGLGQRIRGLNCATVCNRERPQCVSLLWVLLLLLLLLLVVPAASLSLVTRQRHKWPQR